MADVRESDSVPGHSGGARPVAEPRPPGCGGAVRRVLYLCGEPGRFSQTEGKVSASPQAGQCHRVGVLQRERGQAL